MAGGKHTTLRGKQGRSSSKGVKGEPTTGNGNWMWRMTVNSYRKCEENKETRQLCGDQERNEVSKKKCKDRQKPRLFARNPLAEAVTSVCLKEIFSYKLFGLCSPFAIQRATALADASAGGYLGELCSGTKAPEWLKALVLLSPAKAVQSGCQQGSRRNKVVGRFRKRQTLPVSSSMLKLSTFPGFWKITALKYLCESLF